MAEAEEVVRPEEQHLAAPEDTRVTLLHSEKHEYARDSVTQPLLQHQHQDRSVESHKSGTQTATAGPDPKTSVPQELELAGRDEPGCTGSVRSLCSSSSRRECPICSELFNSHGDRRITLLNCDHTLCRRCMDGIMARAKDPGRLRCPFCRQTTPFPQWEIRRLQEESYSMYETGPGLDLQMVPASAPQSSTVETQQEAWANRCRECSDCSCLVKGLRRKLLCFFVAVVLLVLLALLGSFL
ncbi:uncharacterized protein V6R79_004238 [Siganus canaliculatus]